MYKKGLTVVELIVSVTIFTALVGIASGAFVSVIRAQRNAIGLANVQGNASVILEAMAKEIRTGTGFAVSGSSTGGLPGQNGTQLSFVNAKNENVVFSLDAGRIRRQVNAGASEYVSAVNVNVGLLRFVLQGHTANTTQTLITIMASFTSSGVRPEQQISTNVQTSVAQRTLKQ